MASGTSSVNIKEVAKLAKVSTATVSRVINSPDIVKASTRDKVMAVIEKMNYVPKTAIPANSNLIAYMNDFTNPFFNAVFRHLTEIASKENYYTVGCNMTLTPEAESTMFEYFNKMGYAGIVLTVFTRIKSAAADIPVVLLDSAAATGEHSCNITSDNQSAIQTLIDYLLRLNHKKIGFISGDLNTFSGKERSRTFHSYMTELGLSDEYIFPGDFTLKSGFAAFDHFYSLSDIPTAVIAANDEMAKGFIIRANNMGVNIPQDISVCGIDAMEDDYFRPKITSIHQDAEATAKAILEFIKDNRKKSFPENLTLPVTFSPGNTCYKLQE